MAFYFMQVVATHMIKAGIAEDVEARRKQHETASGSVRLLGLVPDGDRQFEISIFNRLDRHRVKDERDSRRDYEVFRPVREVLAFINGETLREFGYQRIAKPVDPRKQTCRDWLHLVRGVCKGDAHDAAVEALRQDARLRRAVPPEARGGWDLNELIGGNGFIHKQTAWDFARDVIAGKRWLIHRITYKGVEYLFPVFAEWYERETRRTAPSNAIQAGIPIGKPKVASGRKGRRRKRAKIANPNQLLIAGAA